MKRMLTPLAPLGLATSLLIGVLPSVGEAQVSCFPTCNTTDAKMLTLAGTGLATLAGDSINLQFIEPAGTVGFDIGIFDGNATGFWDLGTPPPSGITQYTLFADPNGDGSNLAQIGQWTDAGMPDNNWFTIPVTTNPGAQAPSGNFFYRLVVTNLNPALVSRNSFKVRLSNGSLLLKKDQTFSVFAPVSVAERTTVYPAYPALTPTTYDGNWDFYLDVPTSATYLDVWDGDSDFGNYDVLNGAQDTDDPDTPNAPFLPPWATGTAAVPEGVAVGFGGGTGSPADDYSGPLFRRSPDIGYTVCSPSGACYPNYPDPVNGNDATYNPAGNLEWERFRLSTVAPFDRTQMDYLVPAIAPGIWRVTVKGQDLGNLNAIRFDHDLLGVPDCAPGDACDPPPPAPTPKPYLVGDTIFYDANRNGTQDGGDAGIGGVTVNLLDGNGAVISTTTTNASGEYRFEVDAGVYTVQVDTGSGPLAGLTPTVDYTSDNAGDNQRTQTVVNSNLMTYDFGYGDTGSLGDRVWLDSNGNGVQDMGETVVGGVTVTLIGSDGSTRATTTAGDGSYLFVGLKSGVQYTVQATAPNGYVFTTTYSQDSANGTNSNANPANGNMGTYTLSAGQNLLTVDAGLLLKSACDIAKAQTLTQGGWSNKPHAKLLAELYSKPGFSVMIGGANNSVTLTTAAAVQAFLPSGGTPRQLSGKLVNPGNIKNTLAGQTVTATLNITYWSSIANAKLTSGPYQGKTVQEVINLANAALNSGGSSTLLSNLNGALDGVNNNLDDGKVNRGFLTCGTNVSSLPVNNTDDSSKDDDDKSGSSKDKDDDGKSK